MSKDSTKQTDHRWRRARKGWLIATSLLALFAAPLARTIPAYAETIDFTVTQIPGTDNFTFTDWAVPKPATCNNNYPFTYFVDLNTGYATALACTPDGGSLGNANSSPPPVPISDGDSLFIYYHYTTNGGDFFRSNTITYSKPQPDTSPPTITASQNPAPNTNNWHNTNVTVSFSCTDNVAVATCSGPTTFTNEGAGQTTTGTATDAAGNAASASLTVNIDKTAPAINSPTVTPRIILFTGTLNISANVSDALSGIQQGEYYIDTDPGQGNGTALAYNAATNKITATRIIARGSLSRGVHTIFMRAKDKAGNWSSPVSRTFVYI